MIQVNLLPDELKAKSAKSLLNIQSFLYIIPLIIGVLILVHLVFLSIQLVIGGSLFTLQNRWQVLEKDRKSYESFKKEFDSKNMDANSLQAQAGEYTLWAEKLEKFGAYIPAGVWLTEFSFSQKAFTLKASVISLDKSEVAIINQFMEDLKKDTGFMDAFVNLELGTIERRQISSYDIVDFIISGKLK